MPEPLRTCVFCRSKAAKRELLRFVAVEGAVVWDPRHDRPGRGAYAHLRLACLRRAAQRDVWARALRLQGGVLDRAVLEQLMQAAVLGEPGGGGGADVNRACRKAKMRL